jgi:hypothetical protein
VGSSADPTLNGHLKYPNNLDQSLNDAAADKIRKYRADYNNSLPSAVSFIPAIMSASTSGRLHSEIVRLLFLQAHREFDRFFAASGVQSAQSTSVFHFRRAAFLQQLKSKVGLVLAKEAELQNFVLLLNQHQKILYCYSINIKNTKKLYCYSINIKKQLA